MYKKDEGPRKSELDDLGTKMQAAINGKHNADYKYGQGAKILYTAPGTLVDHATSLGALGMTVELRPGTNDPHNEGSPFAPKASEILPTAEECFEGALAAISFAKSMPHM